MIQNDPNGAESASGFDENAKEKRTPKAIRFSESEWNRIKTAATARGISIGGFVRDAALDRASEHSGKRSAPFSPGIEELIKQTFRYAFMLASIKREEFVSDGRNQEIEKAIELAGEAQTELLSGASDNSPIRSKRVP